MAIGGFTSVSTDNNVPFNNDPGQVINEGDMLFWNSEYQAFEARSPLIVPKSLSNLTNDTGYVTEAKVIELLANMDGSGSIDLTSYVTEQELASAIGALPKFSGNYADLTNKPTLPDFSTLSTIAYVDSKVASIPVFSGKYADLLNKPKLFSGNYADLTNRPVLFSGSWNDLRDRPNMDLYATTAFVTTTIDESVDTAIATALTGGTIDLSSYITESELNAALANYEPDFDLDAYQRKADAFSGDYNDLRNKPAAFTGDYNDLINKPYQFSGNYNDLLNKPALFSGLYEDLIGKPAVPDLTGYATTGWVLEQLGNLDLSGVDYNSLVTETELANMLSGYARLLDLNGLARTSELFSGDYNDLVNKPDIPSLAGYAKSDDITAAITNYNASLNLAQYATTNYVDTAIDAIPTFSGNYNDLINKPTIFSGSYLDLTNRPTLFSGNWNDLVNRPNIDLYATIDYVDQQIVNISSGGTIDLSGYVTEAELASALQGVPHPTNVSAFTNDANYITATQLSNELQNYQPTVDLSAYYKKTEVDSLINNVSVDLSAYYDKTQVDSLIASINATDLANYYNKIQIDNKFNSYYNKTQVENLISNAVLAGSGISNINDLDDVAIGGLPTTVSATSLYGLVYNPTNSMWESKNLYNMFATPDYVTQQITSIVGGGSIDLNGYATTNYVDQKFSEVGPHFSGNYYDLVNRPQLFTGNYNDLMNKPTLKQYTLMAAGTTLHLVETLSDPDQIVASIDFGDLGIAFSGSYEDLTNKPILFSGNYNDLSNKPFIPSISGLASENYVDSRWAEPVITGNRTFTNTVVFENFVQQKVSTVNVDAVKRDAVMAVQTTNGIATEVLLRNNARITIADNTTAMFKATVVASSGVDKTALIVKGIIDSTGGVLSMIGSNIVETISDSELGWDVDFSADTTNKALSVVVYGSDNTTIDWTVFIELSEVIR